jgi:hypothetical protein
MARQDQGLDRVRSVICESWQRSRRLGVDPSVAPIIEGSKDCVRTRPNKQ